VTWWKACFIAPQWLYPLLPAFGGALHVWDLDGPGLVCVLLFCFSYFALDLINKNIHLSKDHIRRGLRKLAVGQISKIAITGNILGHKTILWIEDNRGKVMKLHLHRMSGDDLHTLVNVVQRMSPTCRVDSEVDELIRYKRAKKLATIYDTNTTTYVKYHVDRSWEDIPQTFETLFKGWSKLFGPIGILLLCLPMSLFLICHCWNTTFNAWAVYDKHHVLYDALMYVWRALEYGSGCFNAAMLADALQSPFTLLVIMSIVAVTAASYFRAAFGANRITMDAEELSLDSWQYLSSFNLASMKWSALTKITLSNSAKHQRLILTSDKGKSIELDVKGIDDVDRSRLLRTLKRFATHCEIPTAVEELLDPPTTRSYTQLWLQSIAQAPKDSVLKPIESGSTLEGGRYEVIRKLGAGGQGAAYLCHDLRDKNQKSTPTVALKEMLIPPYLSTVIKKGLIESFVAEATMLKSIDSPNVVSLLDYFVEERGAYLVLEHIEGSTLRDLVSETGALDSNLISTLLPQMLDILKLLHTNGIVHRDFTPDNLILRPDGLLKLIDFNVAQDESAGTTATIVGKHAYVPPEQFRGKPTTQSDLYALGATMFFLSTGLDPEPISQSSLPEHLKNTNTEIDELIQMCTAIEVAERVTSVDELIAKYAPKTVGDAPDATAPGAAAPGAAAPAATAPAATAPAATAPAATAPAATAPAATAPAATAPGAIMPVATTSAEAAREATTLVEEETGTICGEIITLTPPLEKHYARKA
jgi:hypothetical protein